MTSIYAKPPKFIGWLERGGKTWRMPITHDLWCLTPVDELFLGDRLHFPQFEDRRNLLLRVTFTSGQLFRDSQRCHGTYELVAQVFCPECGHSAVHDVTIADVGRHTAGGPCWTFTRTCRCGWLWMQDGARPNWLHEAG